MKKPVSSTSSATRPTPTSLYTPVPQTTTSPNLKTEDAAEFLNVKPATLEQWRWNGRGPKFCKIGRSCRYRMADLEAYLDANVFNSTTEAQNRGK